MELGILRDGDPVEGLERTTTTSEPFAAVLPATHPGARLKSISPAVLRDEPFNPTILEAPAPGPDEKPLTLCEAARLSSENRSGGFALWLTILSLIGAGLGVSIAPACVRRIASPEVVCLPLRGAKAVSNIELAWHAGDARPIVERFRQIAESTRGMQ